MAGVRNQLFAFFFHGPVHWFSIPIRFKLHQSDHRTVGVIIFPPMGLLSYFFSASPIFSSDDPTSGVSSPESSALFYLSNSSYDSPSNEGIPTHQWLSDWWNEKSDTGVIGTIDVMMKIKHTSGR